MIGRVRWRRHAVLVSAVALVIGGGATAKGIAAGGANPAIAPPPIALPVWGSAYAWGDGDGYAGWEKQYHLTDGSYARETGGAAPGLWIFPTGGQRYIPGRAGWGLTAPGSTRIARATLALEYRESLFAHHCLRVALDAGTQTRDERLICRPPVPPGGRTDYQLALADPDAAPRATQVSVQVVVPECGGKAPDDCAKWIPAPQPGLFVHVKGAQLTLVDDDDPSVSLSGALIHLDGRYIDGQRIYPLHVSASDEGSGVTSISIDHTGWPGPQPALAEHAAACDPHHRTAELGARLCPASDAVDRDVDTREMPEGTRRFAARATDVASNRTVRRWTVIIDRTPPTAPAGLHFLTPEEGSAQVSRDPATDGSLPDGTQGSGIARYEERHRIGDEAWSGWVALDSGARLSDEVYDERAGTRVQFEVRAIDAVGNVGLAASVGGDVFGASPAVASTGQDGDYVGGESATVTISGNDTGHLASGVKRVWLTRAGVGDIASVDGACVTRERNGRAWKALCPMTASRQVAIDTGSLPEGASSFDVHAIDRAGNDSSGAAFQFLVDHTPPPTVSDVTAEFESDTAEIDVGWVDVQDPDLSDGHPGSGLEHYSYRLQRGGGEWSDWITTVDSGFTLANSHAGDDLHVQIRAYDRVGNESATWDGEVVAADSDDDTSTTADQPPVGAALDEALSTSVMDLEGQDNEFPPGVIPEAGARAAVVGVSVTPPERVQARTAANVPKPSACGRNKYDQNPFDTFRIKFGRAGETSAGDRYYQYHLHYQVRLAWRADVAWTWLAAQRFQPNGTFDPSPYDDSRTRLVRDPIHWKPYYAHFLRLKVKPGSLLTFWGRWEFTAPLPVPEGRMIGAHMYGACYARLNG